MAPRDPGLGAEALFCLPEARGISSTPERSVGPVLFVI
jgi:hypothetical protein